MFTSGTAGKPARRDAQPRQPAGQHRARAAPTPAQLYPDDVVYGVLPLFHIFGLNVVLGSTLRRGATVVLVQRFDPSTALDTIRDRGVTVILGAPPLWLAFSHFDDAPGRQLRHGAPGAHRRGEACPRRRSGGLRERFGLELAEGYGLTEASPVVTSSAGLPIRVGSVGKVLDGVPGAPRRRRRRRRSTATPARSG